MKLIRPSLQYAEIFSEALNDGEIIHMALTDKDKITKEQFDANPDAYFQTLKDIETNDVVTPNGHAYKLDHHELLWMIDDNKFIGCCSLRWAKNQASERFLWHDVGHFGQSIRASMQGQGYGPKQWELAKPIFCANGFNQITRGAGIENAASDKSIRKTGGVYSHDIPNNTGWGKGKMYIMNL